MSSTEAATGPSTLVSIVIVSWNVAELLEACLESIRRLLPEQSTEVIVVDNASGDGTVSLLRQKYPWVRVVASSENLGFARGNNLGLGNVKGRFVFLLNPDTVLTDGALPAMLTVLNEQPKVGIVGPMLCNRDGSVQLPCARRAYSLGTALWCESLHLHARPVIGSWFRRRYVSPYDYARSQEVEAISGAAMLVRREVLDMMAGFGQTFLHCGEDLDLCYRTRAAGWRIWYSADARIIHFGGGSSRQASLRTTVNAALSIQELFRRCHGALHAAAYRLIVQAVSVPTLVLGGVIKRLARRESREDLRGRLEIARCLSAWRAIP